MKRIAVLFSGQGSQYLGMGKKLFERDPAVRELFARASSVLELDMARLCFSSSADELARTENTQPALLLCALADYQHWRAQTGIRPVFLAGHSLGELSALVAAEALTLEDGLRLARERGLAMSRCGEPGSAGMTAITRLGREALEQVCQDHVVPGCRYGTDFVIANDNAPMQCVLSGRLGALEQVGAALRQAGANVIPLKVSGPFHSPFMAPAAEALAGMLQSVALRPPGIAVVSNVDARPHGEPAQIATSLVHQVTSAVRWRDSMAYLHAQGVDVYLEAGPRGVLKRLVQANLAGAETYALDEDEDRAGLQDAFASELRAMREKPSLVTKCLAVAVCTRNGNWDEAQYQSGVVEPYRALQALQETLEREARVAGQAELRSALDLLARIFATKGTPPDEQAWRLAQILETTGTAGQLEGYRLPVPASM